jgi:hypothetical protein
MLRKYYFICTILFFSNIFSTTAYCQSKGPGNIQAPGSGTLPDTTPYQYPSGYPSEAIRGWTHTTSPSGYTEGGNVNADLVIRALQTRIKQLEELIADQQKLIKHYKAKVDGE